MKKILAMSLAALLFIFAGCTGGLELRVDDLEGRVGKLEELCAEMNTNIGALQTIVEVLQDQDYITSVAPIQKDGETIGYTISFAKNGEITIYHGKQGSDGHSPVIGVHEDAGGVYCWTVDGEWMLDGNGQKIPAEGREGMTPELKIENGYWFVRYGDGEAWKPLGKATGADGQDGDAFFQNVVQEGDHMVFTLSDGTVLRVPLEPASAGKIQSLTYLPEYTDGIADVVTTADPEKGHVELTFEVLPKEALPQLDRNWQSALQLHAFYTRQRALSETRFIDMPVSAYRSDPANGTFTITASGIHLDDAFYAGTQDTMAELVIHDGSSYLTSERIQLRPVQQPAPTFADKTLTINGVSFKMIAVKGGTFNMGAQSKQATGDNYDPDAFRDESPVHKVTLSDYYIGETEVTQALWNAVMGSNPSFFQTDNSHHPLYNPNRPTSFTDDFQRPVESVSWYDVVNVFLPKIQELTGQTFALPTEAQWEYAARGGSQSHGYIYSGSNTIGNVAWYDEIQSMTTHPVAQKAANELGIYDMSGNIEEWCSDGYGDYSAGPQTDPHGSQNIEFHVLRGGFWNNYYGSCRVSSRNMYEPDLVDYNVGFRLMSAEL